MNIKRTERVDYDKVFDTLDEAVDALLETKKNFPEGFMLHYLSLNSYIERYDENDPPLGMKFTLEWSASKEHAA